MSRRPVSRGALLPQRRVVVVPLGVVLVVLGDLLQAFSRAREGTRHARRGVTKMRGQATLGLATGIDRARVHPAVIQDADAQAAMDGVAPGILEQLAYNHAGPCLVRLRRALRQP